MEKIAGFPVDHSLLTYKKRVGGIWVSGRKDLNERADGYISKAGLMGIIAILCVLAITTFFKNWRWIYLFGDIYVLFDLFAIAIGLEFWLRLCPFGHIRFILKLMPNER